MSDSNSKLSEPRDGTTEARLKNAPVLDRRAPPVIDIAAFYPDTSILLPDELLRYVSAEYPRPSQSPRKRPAVLRGRPALAIREEAGLRRRRRGLFRAWRPVGGGLGKHCRGLRFSNKKHPVPTRFPVHLPRKTSRRPQDTPAGVALKKSG